MTKSVSDEPEYVPEGLQLGLLRQTAMAGLLNDNIKICNFEMAMDLLKQTVFRMYKHVDVSNLIERSIIVSEADKFSKHMRDAIQQAEWAKSTARAAKCMLRKILAFTAIAPHFMSRISIKTIKTSYPRELGAKYGALPEDNPIRVTIVDWINRIKANTKNRSGMGIKNIIRFIINVCLPAFNLDINNMPENPELHIETKLNAILARQICGNKSYPKKVKWLNIFIMHIMNYNKPVPNEWFTKDVDNSNPTSNPKSNPLLIDDGSDKHKMPVEALEKMYKATDGSTLDRLIFLLLLTTGIRVGGLVRIKLEHVAHVSGSDVAIFDSGRSIEKGNKWFSFAIAPMVKSLMFEWLTTQRPAVQSDYLFPGGAQHMSTSNIRYRFNKIAAKAGVTGSYVHPHAMRHTFGHMMLKTGNTVDTVAKLLGHASSKTTEAFYLKESASEVASRANIPWLDNSNAPPKPIVPNFLRVSDNATDVKEKEKTEKKKLRKKRRMMAQMSMFSDPKEEPQRKKLNSIPESGGHTAIATYA
jgi:hypothetical protein